MLRITALVLSAVVLAAGAAASSARADGDPASDVLVSQAMFVPADAGLSTGQQAQLAGLLQVSKRAGLPVRVAVIPSAYDLGSVQALWRKPGTYARFLGIELSLVYRQALLVVMPNGLGLNWPGHSIAAADRRLAQIRLGAGAAGLMAGTEAAVRAIAGTEGITIASPRRVGGSGNAGTIGIIAGVVAALLAAVLALGVAARRRRRVGSAPAPEALEVPADPGRRPVRLRWAVPGLAAVCGLAIGAPILLLSLVRHAPATASATVKPSSISSAFTWPEDSRPAPGFRLRDQNGRPVSIAAYLGRPFIVTFIDPLCRNLCPLAAQVLDEADRQLPASQRLPIVAVSVDIYADTHGDLMQDFKEWRLVPQWRWAIGTPDQLAKVWNRWGVGVSVQTKRIAGTTVHFISHDEFAFLIDPSGFERALFVWPYGPQDIVTELQQLSRS
ncbi:MAG TPA: SCO family protein [Solirubrobacteraceae bacterium]|nr:SCO family protein [Solirubrobacteraceae bacterium]